MGNQCSQNVQINMSTEPNLDVFLKSSFNMSTPSNNLLSVQAIPLLKSQGDIDAQDDEQSPSFGTRLEVAKEPKYYSRFQSNDCGGASQNEETNVPLSKKAVSFFHFNSLENQSNPVEFSSQVHSDDWNLKSVRLDSLIHKSHGKFIWEAHNTQTQKKCTVKVRLIESSKLLHTNLTKTEGILRELNVIKNPYVAEVYSFSIWETQIKNQSFFVIVVVQEPTKCSLRDIHSFKVDNEKKWTQTQILTLLHDIYSGLVACKERRITHGELILENILFSENMENAILSDFHLRLPLTGETRVSTSPIKSIFAKQGNPEASPSEAAKSLLTPDEKDIQDLLGITLQLMAVKDIPGANLEEVKTDEKYKQSYPRVLEALDEIVKKTKIPSQIIKNLEGLINNKPRGFGFDLSQTVLTTDRQDTIVDVLFTKIDCYEIINHHESAKEAYTELMSVLENKDFKGLKECEEYIKCVNKAIKYYLSTNDWLKAKEVSSELNSLLKTDQTLKNAIKAQPKQYINYIFLLGNIYEGLSEPEKAISFYIKGLTYCNKTVPDPDEYSLALRNVSNLCMKKKDYTQALDYLKKLVAFYEAQEGNYSNKADAYIRMGDVLADQGNLGQGVKLYLKAIDNFKKENSNYDIATLEVLKKVVKLYKDLHEGDNALFYMIKSHDLKKSLFGNDSPAYLEAVKEIGDTHLEMKKYEEALTFYLKCYKLSNNNQFLTEQYTTSLSDLGNIYVKTKKYAKANEFYEKYSEIKSQGNDKASKEYFNVRDMLADIAFRENKFSKALDIQQKSYALKQQVFKADDMYLIISLTNIGDTYLANGEFEKALECHQKCLEKLEPKQTAFLQEYSQILLKIACDYNELGNGGQALALIHKSFQVSMRNGHETDMEKTIEVYETLNKLKEKKAVGLNFSKLNGGTA